MLSVIDFLEQLECNNSRILKEELLNENSNNLLLKSIFKVVGDPYINFYINKFKAPKSLEKSTVSDNGAITAFIEMLHQKLSTRQVTGNAAKHLVESFFEGLDERQAKWCQRILLKNLRCGVSLSTISKVWPRLIVGFSVQLAETLKTRYEIGKGIIIDDKIVYPIQVEPKLDGLRCVVIKHNGEVTMHTRSGNIINTLPLIKSILEKASYDEFVLDGECLGTDWNESASVMMSHKTGKDDSNMIFHVFDALPFSEWQNQESHLDLVNRLELVGELVKNILHPAIVQVQGKLVDNEKELIEAYICNTDAGYEGIMIKDLFASYVFKRSSNIRKMKPCRTFEGIIVGHYEGTRGTKREGLWGGFEVILSNGVLTRVGGGFTDKLKSEINIDPSLWIGRAIEMEGQPDPLTDDGLTRDGRIRFPVFIRRRDHRDIDSKLLIAFNNHD